MISAQELRNLQKTFLNDKEGDFIQRIKDASDLYYKLLMEEAQKSIVYAQQNNLSYSLLNFTSLTQPVDIFTYTNLLYGIWINKYTNIPENLFLKYEITPPFDRAVKELEIFGYKLENVSDPNKSRKIYIKLSWLVFSA